MNYVKVNPCPAHMKEYNDRNGNHDTGWSVAFYERVDNCPHCEIVERRVDGELQDLVEDKVIEV